MVISLAWYGRVRVMMCSSWYACGLRILINVFLFGISMILICSFLAYKYLAICFGMIFIAFLLGWIDKVIIRSKDDHKVLLVLFHIGLFLEWLVNASKRHREVYQVLLASVIQNRVMALLVFV
ncbi:hypothetical protein YC2023_081210 [Brassica napus]